MVLLRRLIRRRKFRSLSTERRHLPTGSATSQHLILGGSTLLSILALASAGPAGPWIAFRYDTSHVLFYLGEMKDPAKFTEGTVKRQQVKNPLAHWGVGGYLIPLTSARRATFQPSSNTNFPEIHRGDHVHLLLSGDTTVTGSVDGFLEQWGASNPIVQIGVLARVSPDQLRAFKVAKSDYFLAYLGTESAAAVSSAAGPGIIGRRRILNNFGSLGKLVLIDGDAGWNITLWRRIDGKLAPTTVSYAYGD